MMAQNPNEQMQKIDMTTEFRGMSSTDRFYIRKLESLTAKRASVSKAVKGRNKMTAAILGTGVFSICKEFSIFSI